MATKYKIKFPKLGSTASTILKSKVLNEHDYNIMSSLINDLSYDGLIIPRKNFKANIFQKPKGYLKK